MSVSLSTVITAGGYDLSTYEDALWLLSKQAEFYKLIEAAEEVVDKAEYQAFIDKELLA